METYEAFIERINSIQPHSFRSCANGFTPDPSVRDKVAQDGKLRPFYGDTVIFCLSESIRRELTGYQDAIHDIAGEYLAERLAPGFFHMTLHDLSIFGGPTAKPPHYAEVRAITADILRESFVIGMRSTWVFSMASRSIVLGLVPLDGMAYNQLMQLYGLYDRCVPLPYPFTPHITLAYYKGNGIPAQVMLSLDALAEDMSHHELIVPLESDNLGYYHFSNMNQYDPYFFD